MYAKNVCPVLSQTMPTSSCLHQVFSLVLAEVLGVWNRQFKPHSILILYKDHPQSYPESRSQTKSALSSQYSISHCLCLFMNHCLTYQSLFLALSCSCCSESPLGADHSFCVGECYACHSGCLRAGFEKMFVKLD